MGPAAPALPLPAAFARHFGRAPLHLCRAPGRVNLIGEHTDYSAGWVMPAAIPLWATVALAPRPGRRIHLRSEAFPDAAVFDLDALATGQGLPAEAPSWSRSLGGVAALLERGGRRLGGADLLLRSQIPIGAGLSSSAAVEVAVGFALAAASGFALDPTALARLCQQASHEFGGTRCGIMDQYIACHGRAGAVVQLDTRSLAATWHPWPAGLRLVACDTGVRHNHATGAYNQRRAECEAALEALRRRRPGIAALRDVSGADLEDASGGLDPLLAARCRHVVSENARVLAAAAALAAGDHSALGQILNASHRSLRDDFEVSCPELDAMAELCRNLPGVRGARMMGGGFGGCVLALADAEAVANLQARLPETYRRATGRQAQTWDFWPADGVGARPNVSENLP